jgi:glycosyltransferase involved in cell wall biosynthesis
MTWVTVVDGVEDQLDAGGDAEFFENPVEIFLDGVLVEAFEQVKTDVKLVLAGASSYCAEYSQQLRSHASESIRILDWVSGEILDELLTNAMIFVLPSDLEGLSLALLDAMGAGLCVLTSDVPENVEVVDGAGFTFKRGNSADLADRLRFLIATLLCEERLA